MKRSEVIRELLSIIFIPLLSAFAQDGEPTSSPAKTYKDGTVVVETGRSEKSPWKSYNTCLIKLLDGYTIQKQVATDVYGGRADQKGSKATGCFYKEKIGDRWWLVDPDGNQYFNIKLNGVRPRQTGT